MLKNTALTILILLISWQSFGQELNPDSLIRYTGHIFNATDSSFVPNAHILNLTKGTGTVSSADGSFELAMRFCARDPLYPITTIFAGSTVKGQAKEGEAFGPRRLPLTPSTPRAATNFNKHCLVRV